jgi:pimeloyl-ACP methyl ester carboxylesterase
LQDFTHDESGSNRPELSKDYVRNDGVAIHFIDSGQQTEQLPLLICPGLSETAEEYAELIDYLKPRRCVALSFRGRGGSGTPEKGYDCSDHVTDIEAVVRHLGLERFHLFAYSRGVSYALGYLEQHRETVESVLLQDYPPQHKSMTPEWGESYIHDYLIPYGRLANIRPEAVRGIVGDSVQRSFEFGINKPMIVLRGMLEGGLLDDADIQRYREMNARAEIANFEHSAHDIRNTEKETLFATISAFLDRNDPLMHAGEKP